MTTLHFTEEQRDCLQELVNVAMGQASDKLARYLDTFVHLQVPAIALVDAAEFAARTPATADLSHNLYGMGREMFGGMRMVITGAEQGACSLFNTEEQYHG